VLFSWLTPYSKGVLDEQLLTGINTHHRDFETEFRFVRLNPGEAQKVKTRLLVVNSLSPPQNQIVDNPILVPGTPAEGYTIAD
jgi:hypothetical protein